MKIHLLKRVSGIMRPLREDTTACNTVNLIAGYFTSDKKKVTCKRCMKSKEFK